MKSGSYPNPLDPRGYSPSVPVQTPSVTSSNPFPTRTSVARNCARRRRGATPRISRRSFSLFCSSVDPSPAYLAERTPGRPLRKNTSSPESSARAARPDLRWTSRAFMSAFSRNVNPSSFSSSVSPSSSRLVKIFPVAERSVLSSRILCLFRVARMMGEDEGDKGEKVAGFELPASSYGK